MAETKTSGTSKPLPIVRFFKDLFLNNRFFYVMFGIILFFVLSFINPTLLGVAKLLVLIFLVVVIVDILLLFGTKKGINAKRILPEKFSNGDANKVSIEINNGFSLKMFCSVIDELPFQAL